MRVLASALLVLSLGSLASVATLTVTDRADAGGGFKCGSGKPNPTTAKCDCVSPQVEKSQAGVSMCVDAPPQWKPPPQCPPGQKRDGTSGKCVAVAAPVVKPPTSSITCPEHSHLIDGKCVGDVACIPGTHFVAGDGCVVDGLLPQACGQVKGKVDYGGLKVGSHVVLGKHRAVNDDEYWADEMGKYVGLTAEVRALSDVDGQGCGLVQVDADNETYFWRIRDLKPATRPAVEAAPTTTSAAAIAGDFEQACGQKLASVRYGLSKGDSVVLGKHRDVDGDPYWAPEMAKYVGTTTTVTDLAGVDPKGCAVVRVEADKKSYYWRVRDLKRGYGAVAPATTIAEAYTDTSNPGDYAQECGKTGVPADYAPLKVGDTVILGRHRMYKGDDDWASDMDAFVGKLATITKLDGVYGAGCPYVRVDIDKGAWAWRLRDLRRPGKAASGLGATGAELPAGATWSSGVWMIDRSSDGTSAHIWTAGGSTAIELWNGSNGWWRLRKGMSEKVVYSDRSTGAQTFAERPWRATPYGTTVTAPRSWSMSSGGYTTKIHIDGSSFTVTLSDGKTITGDASGALWFDGKAM
jgi:hypothetical protein